MNLKGTKTEQNLQTAFAGESQARNKYTFYASQAKKEGFEQIAAPVSYTHLLPLWEERVSLVSTPPRLTTVLLRLTGLRGLAPVPLGLRAGALPEKAAGRRVWVRMYSLSGATRQFGPVSYTHLDVYKRQVIDCAGRQMLCSE